jgi:putative transposase
MHDGAVRDDGRKDAIRAAPANKLSEEERAQILTVANGPEFASLPPSQIVPTLADEGEYLASESTFYRVLKRHRSSITEDGQRSRQPES